MANLPPTCTVERDARGVAAVVLSGEHDITSIDVLRTTLAGVATSGKGVVVDLSQVEFIDSSVIHTLVQAHDDLHPRLVLQVATTPSVRRVLEITGLTRECRSAKTRDEAIQLVLHAPPVSAGRA